MVLSRVWDRKQFEFEETDIIDSGSKAWRNYYEFDVPVIHVENTKRLKASPIEAIKSQKLMHRFTEQEVEALIEQVEKIA
ncbi:MAG: hypothetical protein M1814_000551 [Vezdaea aestivalis]|nr:MAG: hypothetical protein M1814_000551 [Vezdaea aestivalis]